MTTPTKPDDDSAIEDAQAVYERLAAKNRRTAAASRELARLMASGTCQECTGSEQELARAFNRPSPNVQPRDLAGLSPEEADWRRFPYRGHLRLFHPEQFERIAGLARTLEGQAEEPTPEGADTKPRSQGAQPEVTAGAVSARRRGRRPKVIVGLDPETSRQRCREVRDLYLRKYTLEQIAARYDTDARTVRKWIRWAEEEAQQ